MSNTVTIPYSIWQEVCAFFERLVAPCKECVRGNPVSCWHSQCAAFQFREISRAVLSVRTAGNQKPRSIPNHVKIENEILQALAEYDRPVPPSALKLWTVNSKSAKSKAISRLIKRGCIIEERASDFVRYISLPKKRNPENEQPKPAVGGDTTSRRAPNQLGQRPSDTRANARKV